MWLVNELVLTLGSDRVWQSSIQSGNSIESYAAHDLPLLLLLLQIDRQTDSFIKTIFLIHTYNGTFLHSWHEWEGFAFTWKMTQNFHQIFLFWDSSSQKKQFIKNEKREFFSLRLFFKKSLILPNVIYICCSLVVQIPELKKKRVESQRESIRTWLWFRHC